VFAAEALSSCVAAGVTEQIGTDARCIISAATRSVPHMKGIATQLTIERAYELVTSHGVFARDYCDRCGRVLGAVWFTRNGEAGEWYSRECRGDAQRQGAAKGGVRESIGTSKSGGPPKPGNRGIIETSPCGKGPPAGWQKQPLTGVNIGSLDDPLWPVRQAARKL